MSRETANLVHGFHAGVESAVGLTVMGLLTAGRDAADECAAHAARLGAARAHGEAEGLQDVIDRLRDQLACANADIRGLKADIASLELDNSILREMVIENA